VRVLVFGAGVLGSLYAARLHRTGQDVTLLARGERLQQLREQGVVLEEASSGRRSTTYMPTTERLNPDDHYDVIIVLVRKPQLAAVLPTLAANRATPTVLVMVSNAEGPSVLADAIGRERLVLGFAGAGGTLTDGVVTYQLVPARLQPTMLGELDGSITPRLRALRSALRGAGLPVALEKDMDAWLKTHEVWIGAAANAIYAADGDNVRLGATRDAVVLMLRAIAEGFTALEAIGTPITPGRLRALRHLPEALVVPLLQRLLPTHHVEVLAVRHANAARNDEMRQLADEVVALLASSPVPTPTVNDLFRYVDPAVAPLPSGAATLPLRWRPPLTSPRPG
jgi:2-dehydropantoate 2-reductase